MVLIQRLIVAALKEADLLLRDQVQAAAHEKRIKLLRIPREYKILARPLDDGLLGKAQGISRADSAMQSSQLVTAGTVIGKGTKTEGKPQNVSRQPPLG